MNKAMDRVVDTVDIETYLLCKNESEGKRLALQLGEELNLGNVDIMFQEFDGYGVRVRLRKYIHKPGKQYKWLTPEEYANGA